VCSKSIGCLKNSPDALRMMSKPCACAADCVRRGVQHSAGAASVLAAIGLRAPEKLRFAVCSWAAEETVHCSHCSVYSIVA
jgi:hypothetical protein